MSLMIELVKRLSLSNQTQGETVFCPECSESIKADEQKVVAGKHVRHQACHLAYRHRQRYQTTTLQRAVQEMETQH